MTLSKKVQCKDNQFTLIVTKKGNSELISIKVNDRDIYPIIATLNNKVLYRGAIVRSLRNDL